MEQPEFGGLKVVESQRFKLVSSSDYNQIFEKFHEDGRDSGHLVRWGKIFKEDPPYAPSCEILDLEISAGRCVSGCNFCYKGNSPDQPIENMSLSTFKTILDKVSKPGILGQIALGLTGVGDNPNLLSMMRYARDLNITPNFTVNGGDLTITLELAENLASLCGALAVSVTPWNCERGLDLVKLFTDLGVEQTNIHAVISRETIPFVNRILDTTKKDKRLRRLNAVVGLMVKPKGRAQGAFTPPTRTQYEALVERIIREKIPAGFDSCSCNSFLTAAKKFITTEEFEQYEQNSDPCESMCFSAYIDVKGRAWPCSFCEDVPDFTPVDVLTARDFVKDVWYSKMARNFREKLLETGRSCPVYQEVRELHD